MIDQFVNILIFLPQFFYKCRVKFSDLRIINAAGGQISEELAQANAEAQQALADAQRALEESRADPNADDEGKDCASDINAC